MLKCRAREPGLLPANSLDVRRTFSTVRGLEGTSFSLEGTFGARIDKKGLEARIGLRLLRRCGRVAEGGGLLNRYRSKAYRRFESCHLRHQFSPRAGYLDEEFR